MNWSALIPLKIIKEKLNFDEGSYLTNTGKSKRFTFIRKTRYKSLTNEYMIDINMMPPMVIKNCLPVKLFMRF